MTLSAAINLRSLFVSNPEMIGARYAGRLLPTEDRIEGLIDLLRERSGVVEAPAGTPGRGPDDTASRVSAAFMLAYLGYQTGRHDVTAEGLDILVDIGSPEDVRMGVILRQVWLPDSAPADDTDGKGTEDGAGVGDGR
jgi:hypothetical protein